MKTIIIKIIFTFVIFINIIPITFSQKTDYRDNFIGDYWCLRTELDGSNSLRHLHVIKSIYNSDIIDIYDSTGITYTCMRLLPDSTFQDTSMSWIWYGHFYSIDSIYLHYQWPPIERSYYGKKINTNIFEENLNNNILICPNPAKENAIIYFSENGITNITIYNIFGKEVFYHNLQNNKGANSETINVSGWANGMYIVKTNTTVGIKTSKLIVE